MSITIKNIELSQIRTESYFRDEESDLFFIQDIKTNGLNEPLIVEKENESLFVLVDGYRRYDILSALGVLTVECIVQPYTSKEKRIIKRLGKAFRPGKRRTAYQLKEMIEQLIANDNYTIKLIALHCGVSEKTIQKYIKVSEIDPELLMMVEHVNKGYTAAEIIHNSRLNINIKKELLERYLNEKLNLEILKMIRNITKEKAFEKIPTAFVKEFIDEEIIETYYELKKFPNKIIEKYISHTYMKTNQNDINNLFMYLKIMEESGDITRFIDKLSNNQKDDLLKLFIRLIFKIYPTLNWLNVPVNNHYFKVLEKGNFKPII